ncbi:MAG: VWA domain-containing protein [Dehalococcoidia bacterium]
MIHYRYSRWDGTQNPFAPGGEELLDEISERLFEHGDLERALRDLFRRGMHGPEDQKMPGLQDLMQRLREQRSQRTQQYDLDSVMDDLRERMDSVIDHERGGAERSVSEAQERLEQVAPEEREQLSSMMDLVRKRADDTVNKLDSLPDSVGGSVRELTDHDFIDDTARDEFNELLDMLRRQMVSNVAKQAAESLQNMDQQQQSAMREMMRNLNEMLRQKLNGEEPDFQQFMDRFGQYFGDDPPQSLDELLDRMQQQMAQMQSLMAGMSPEERQQLMEALAESLDEETLREMAELGALMQALRPPSDLARQYPFMGQESLTLDAAMNLMGDLQQMDSMERSLQEAARSGDLNSLNPEELDQMIGPGSGEAVDQLKEIAEKLEEMGYAQRKGDRWEITPRAIRKLADKALKEVFGRLGRANIGGHRTASVGTGGEPTGDTKLYELGEAFEPNLNRSLMNAVTRRGRGTPVQFELGDFEVDRMEHTVSAATVLLLDQSSSMVNGDRWSGAKKVAMALQSLIQGQFPRDRLFIVGFSDHAEEIKARDLPAATPNMWLQGTNMHHALMLARRILSKERAGTRQVIMVTDGEPTAHIEQGYPYFNYPPARRTITETLLEVKRCTSAGITINTFMLERTPYLAEFIDYVTRINRGRAFFTSPHQLGDYVLVDYLSNRRKRVA